MAQPMDKKSHYRPVDHKLLKVGDIVLIKEGGSNPKKVKKIYFINVIFQPRVNGQYVKNVL